jgi:hypothetical protein
MFRVAFLVVLISGLALTGPSFGQPQADPSGSKPSVPADTITEAQPPMSPSAASDYLKSLLQSDSLWRRPGDTLRLSVARLLDHFQEPFDSVEARLRRFPYDSVRLEPGYLVARDTLPLRWLDRQVFFVDTIPLEKDPYVTRKTVVVKRMDTVVVPFQEPLPEVQALIDSVLGVRDTIYDQYIDVRYLESKGVQLHRLDSGGVEPPLLPPGSRKTAQFLGDSTRLVVSEATRVIMGGGTSPFFIVPGPMMPDSLRMAVEVLLAHTVERDSILLQLRDIDGRQTPFWLSTGKDDLYRYWVKNPANDSVTIWMGNPSRGELVMLLEEEVTVERLEKRTADDIPITTAVPQRTLAPVRRLNEIPIFWKFGLNSSFSLSQNYLSNWARGGESSLAGMLDVNASARYTNKANKAQWTSSGRLRYGTIRTRERGARTSTDIVELNSQYNKELREKLDFSTVFYMKTQVAEGFNYPNDSVPVSRFLNPGAFTLGMGVEFKPLKDFLVNFSALSYRNTFVLDTAAINQTTHGIDPGRRSRQEMGGQLLVRNKFSILDGMNVSNSLRLFSNYLDKPQNVDVDWELSVDKQISWYFTIRVNLHLIYDDDIRFPVMDDAGNPVLLPDGSERKVARPQLNQFLGLTLSFRV